MITDFFVHTMATPELSAIDAVQLSASLGFDGIELIVDDQYPCALKLRDNPEPLLVVSKQAGVKVGGLTCYTRGLDQPDKTVRNNALDQIRQHIELAAGLEARFVRILAGSTRTGSSDDNSSRTAILVDSLQNLCEPARSHTVQLLIENHQYTLADSAAATRHICDLAGTEVGVIYDQANLTLLEAEDEEQAISLQGDRIEHIHVKNMRKRTGIEDRLPTNLADGDIDWAGVFDLLDQARYQGTATWEYEKRWFPTLLPHVTAAAADVLSYLKPWRQPSLA